MKKYLCIIIMISCLSVSYVYAEKETVNERLIRVEESIKGLAQRIDDTNKRIDELRQDMNRRFDDQNVLNYFILGGIFTVLALISTLIVLIIWDRRSTLKPIIDEITNLQKLKTKVYEIYEHLGLDKPSLQQFKTA